MASYIGIIVGFSKFVYQLNQKIKSTNKQYKILLESLEPLKEVLFELQNSSSSITSIKISRKLEMDLDKLMRYLLKASKKSFSKRCMNISNERSKVKSYIDNILILIGEHNMAALNKLSIDINGLPNKISNSMSQYIESELCTKFEDLKKFVQDTNQSLLNQITQGINERKNGYCETLNRILRTEFIDFETFWMKFEHNFLLNSDMDKQNFDKAKASLKYYFSLNRKNFDIRRMIFERKAMTISPILLDDINQFLSEIWDYKYSKRVFMKNQIIIPSLDYNKTSSSIILLSLSNSFTAGGVLKGNKYNIQREISNIVIPFISNDNKPIAYLDRDDFCWYLTPANENCRIYYLLETSLVLQSGYSFLINCGNNFLPFEISSLTTPKNSESFYNSQGFYKTNDSLDYSRAFSFNTFFNEKKKVLKGDYDIFIDKNRYALKKSCNSLAIIRFEDTYYTINKTPNIDVWVNVCEGKVFSEVKFLLDSTTTLFINRKEFKVIYTAE
ncbi:hypothetical protein SteCoe_15349 [Stentor coeruleus]|uniref:Uncharacterized protein n=1 Tax=Stentor coeruleus TaxID=5963 RepID=A0A1R2C3Y3_9CILI|nr:hypothetical protein SteCoe_15349 [Stentor coeruleus]